MTDGSNNRIDLSDSWELAANPDGPWRAATVPGNWWLDGVDGPETVCGTATASTSPNNGLAVRCGWGRCGRLPRHRAVGRGADRGAHRRGSRPFTVAVPATAGRHELVIEVACPTDPFGEVWPHTKTTIRGVMGHHDARPGNWTARGQERSTGGIWGPVTLTVHDTCALDTVRFTTAVARR